MAQRKKSTAVQSKTRTSTKPANHTKPAASRTSNAQKKPHRREVAAGICFLLGVFTLIGYFNSDPIFISIFTGLVKRFIGFGFFALSPALIMCSVILAFHKGYPILLRVISTLSLTSVIGALFHVFLVVFAREESKGILSFSMFGSLWTDGAALESGGIISGGITELFVALFGDIGTLVTLIIVGAVLALIAFNATLSGVLSAIRGKQLQPYEVEQESDDTNEADVFAQQEHERIRHGYRFPLIPQWKKKKIDIPIDGDSIKKKDVFADDTGDDTAPWEDQQKIEDLPLDIPFMDGRMKRNFRHPVVPEVEEVSFMGQIEKPPYTRSEKRKLPFVPEPEGNDNKIAETKTKTETSTEADKSTSYTYPPIDLLSKGNPSSRVGGSEVVENTNHLEAAFLSFGITVNITNTTCGPSVTRYEAELEAGTKLNKITNLADDIALALGTLGVRIAAMPNKKATVGIEVPNKNVSNVHLRDIIESAEFRNSQSKLSFAIGMDISGERIVGDISRLPHLLIAGTTGSGKSVCLNSIILSLLYKATPDEVRLIMIDPKLVEFKVYANIPHLLVPLVTEAKKAAGALQWATFEMMKRYKMFSDSNARDIESFNTNARKPDNDYEPIPRVVIIIDELADLMLTAAKEVEEYVCRVAQMGRAAGIHLVIATQSPRANVITGLMKANIPSRIAFKVASALESQIILDPGQNADKLVGNGDMLYSPTGIIKPLRIQGTWVSDKEREKVVEFIGKTANVSFDEEVMHEIEKNAEEKESSEEPSRVDNRGSDDNDELLPQAVDVFLESGQASVSLLQRRLRLGYARAARIVDQMEDMGIIGSFEGSKSREMLISRDQWRQMQYGTGVAPVDTIFQEESNVELP